jgi:uncharacterized Zn finger protein
MKIFCPGCSRVIGEHEKLISQDTKAYTIRCDCGTTFGLDIDTIEKIYKSIAEGGN